MKSGEDIQEMQDESSYTEPTDYCISEEAKRGGQIFVSIFPTSLAMTRT